MSYVPPPQPPPTAPAGSRRQLWGGIATGVVACLGLPFLGVSAGFVGSLVLAPLLVLVAGVVLVVPEATRRWGSGLLIGFAVSLVIGAGACVVLLTTFSSTGG